MQHKPRARMCNEAFWTASGGLLLRLPPQKSDKQTSAEALAYKELVHQYHLQERFTSRAASVENDPRLRPVYQNNIYPRDGTVRLCAIVIFLRTESIAVYTDGEHA